MASASAKAWFSALEVGYDTDADNDIDDVVVTNPFASTSITPDYDSNGNLTYDGTYKYTYDAWPLTTRLMRHEMGARRSARCQGKATLNDTDVVIQSAEFDGLGRRIRKTVTNSGDLDGITVYLYNGQQIIETRDGSGP